MARPRVQKPPKVMDYANDQINRLALAISALDQMEPDERNRALVWFKSKYAKEWPSDMS